jgi:hypothetical protein
MSDGPTGTVTFLLTDLEGSTVLWENGPTGLCAESQPTPRIR